MVKQSFINGATLTGTAIALYSFSELLNVSGWKYILFVFGTFFLFRFSFGRILGINEGEIILLPKTLINPPKQPKTK